MAVSVGTRLGWLDALRGLAVVLMVVDHLLAVVAPESSYTLVVRHTVTRAALPVFVFCTGYLLGHRTRLPSGERVVLYAFVGLASSVAFDALGLPVPDPVLGLAITIPVWGLVIRRPVESAMFGIVQSFTWPVGWAYYEPGVLIALLAVGVLSVGRFAGQPGNGVPWARFLGRHALTIYAAHVVGLVVVARVFGRL